ncbi:hypothetical protein BN946_scf184943.g89 [Trametes cinnabarina]|uniref:NAD-dependent epimerase/dehydratase domain-containing protein n=1 Tax=Pycnoporus cinnabarinus TaxID=5643 RepID=A0A060SIJ1_PYCCI|nr:hypothetical protein BN946_scf184943.g89 [Trametes cinnabarina]
MAHNVVLITGAGGFLGGQLARALASDTHTAPAVRLILVDVVEPKAPQNVEAVTIKADLTDPTQADGLFDTKFGVPDTVYCLHGIMSRGSEDNFDFGVKVNIDSVRTVLDAARHAGQRSGTVIKFIFTSSLAVYGGPLPPVATQDTIATPQSAYGMAKLVDEIFINEYTRRGFVDGRILRLPTIVVRPGAPSAAASSFVSALEAVAGADAVARIWFEDDETNRRVVSSWPARFDNSYALSLGFVADEGGMVPIVKRFKEQLLAGEV